MSALPKSLWIIITLIAMVISFSAGFWAAQTKHPNSPPISNASSLFNTQTASLQGQIIAVNGQTLTVRNSKNNTGQLILAKGFSISSYPKGVPKTSSDIKDIELNKDVMIVLTSENGEFRITNINYLLAPLTNTTPPTNE